MIDNIRRSVAVNTTVIDQLRLDRHWRDSEMSRDFILFFLRVIPAQHVVHEGEGTQKLRGKRALHLLPVTERTRCREQGFGRTIYPVAEQAITDEASQVEPPTCLPS